MNNKSYIGIGTNRGDRHQNITTALQKITKFAKITNKSSIYETDPMGYKNQGKFLNLVIEIETELKPEELLEKLLRVEQEMGRIRTIKNGPRIIDLDILLYNDEKINKPNLKIPHPKMNEREFVLKPLSEIWTQKKLKN